MVTAIKAVIAVQHPELATLFWSGALLAVFLPLAVRLYARRHG